MGGQDFQADGRAALAADQLDHVAELHVGHVDDLAVFSLAHAEHLVVFRQPFVLVGGTAGNDLLDDGVALGSGLQRGSDSVEVQPHLDFEIVERVGRHVAGVRIVGGRQRGQEQFEQLVVVGLAPALEERVVACATVFPAESGCRRRLYRRPAFAATAGSSLVPSAGRCRSLPPHRRRPVCPRRLFVFGLSCLRRPWPWLFRPSVPAGRT